MPNETPNLAMPYIMPSQAQKHITHNEAIELLDTIVQLTFESASATAPPSTPSEGQAWGIGASPTGAWAGEGGKVASWRGGGWMFVSPQDGWMAWCKDDSDLKVYSGGNWQTLATLGV